MTLPPLMIEELAQQLRRMTEGFANEIAVAWPLLPAGPGLPVIASVGSGAHVSVAPDRVFRYALRVGAAGVVLAHNHPLPTGPSAADRAVTRRLVAAGHILDVPLVAHIVVEPGVAHELVGDRLVSPDATAARA